jgi:hypothetical protein
MIKESNVQKAVIIPKEISKKIEADAKKNYCSFSTMVKQILIEYYKNK